jgi:serine/threonine protein kinase
MNNNMSSEKAPASLPMLHQPQERGIYYWCNEWRIATASQIQSLKDGSIVTLIFIPLWLVQLVTNVILNNVIPLSNETMAWLSVWWFPKNEHPSHPKFDAVGMNDVVDDDNEHEDDNNSTNDEIGHDTFHEKIHHPSDDVTITEIDDDDDDDDEEDDTTTTMDVDADQDGQDILRSICQETKQPKKLYTLNDLHRHRMLGSGQFGQVWLVSEKNQSSNIATSTTITKKATTEYALKVISKYDLIVNDEVDMIIREKNIMNQLSKERHPFIVQLQATFQNDNFLFLLQEICPGGELFSLMYQKSNNNNNHNRVRLPVNQVAFYTLCIADALEYMHTKHSMVYRDLKPENIMLDAYGYPKLIDMGYTKVLQNEDDYMAYTFCGTPNYIAPEMIQISSTVGCSFHVDHWALGILVHELLFGSHPFNTNDDMDQMELFNCVCYDEFTVSRPENDDNDVGVSKDAIHFMTQLLIKDPTLRLGRTIIGGDSVCDHPFLTTAFDIHELRNQSITAPWIPSLDTLEDRLTTNGKDSPTPTDFFQQQYPKLSKREKALFDSF